MYSERQNKLLKYLAEVKSARVVQLAELFQVSIETIRKDLIDLEIDGMIRRTRGGAVFEMSRARELEFNKKLEEAQLEKVAIANEACRYIDDGDALVISNGAANIAFAKALAERKKDLTVVTTSPDIANIINENPTSTVFITGGKQRKHNKSLVGSLAVDCLDKFRVDKSILNIDGLTIPDGVTQYNIEETAVLRKMLEISHTRIILTESSRFGVAALNRICRAEEIHLIITDWDIPSGEVVKWEERGIKTIAAKRKLHETEL